MNIKLKNNNRLYTQILIQDKNKSEKNRKTNRNEKVDKLNSILEMLGGLRVAYP